MLSAILLSLISCLTLVTTAWATPADGSFEDPALPGFRFNYRQGGEKSKALPGRLEVRQDFRQARSGKYSLYSISEFSDGSTATNLAGFEPVSGARYSFSVSYFINSFQPGARVSGRVMCVDAENKVLRHFFPTGVLSTGVWNTMQYEFVPPLGTAKVHLTFWLSGAMQAWIDDFTCQKLEHVQAAAQTNAGILLSNEQLVLWQEAPYFKVPAAGLPDGAQAQSEIFLSAAANEHEPFHLVVTPKRNFAPLSLQFSDLQGPAGTIPARQLVYKILGYVELQNPDDSTVKGLNSDPLLPEQEKTAAPEQNLPFYVTVQVPPEQPAGWYQGQISLCEEGKTVATARLRVQVRSFALPAQPFLRNHLTGRPNKDYLKLDPRSWEEVTADFNQIRASLRIYDTMAPLPIKPECQIQDGVLTITDWTKFDASVELLRSQYGVRASRFPFSLLGDNSGWFREPPQFLKHDLFTGDRPGLRYLAEYCRQFEQHVLERFPGYPFVVDLYDEPPQKVLAEVKLLFQTIKDSAPSLILTTTKAVTEGFDFMDRWIIPLSPGHHQPEVEQAARAAGKEIWFYNWSGYLGAHNYINNRIFPWMTYLAQGTGTLLWNSMHTPAGVNPWTGLEKTYGGGAATILYPPRHKGEGILLSLRAMQRREATDDFDYFCILENQIDRLFPDFPGVGRRRVTEILGALFSKPPFEFSKDANLLYALRNRLGDEIEALAQQPAAVVVSQPPENALTEQNQISFTAYGPPGATVSLEGRAQGQIGPDSRLEFSCQLPHLGRNVLSLSVSQDGREVQFQRTYTLQEDPQLAELRTLLAQAEEQQLETAAAKNFLAAVGGNKPYGEAQRQQAAQELARLRQAIVGQEVTKPQNFPNALAQALFNRAGAAYQRRQFNRAGYYLTLSRSAAAAGSFADHQVQLLPTEYGDYPGFLLSNGRLAVTLLETGGRIISYQVDGVECLLPGNFESGLTLEERASQKVSKEMVTRLKGLGGFEDAGGYAYLWPVSFVDWDVELVEIKPTRAAIAFSALIPDTPYLLRRTVSLSADSLDLHCDYVIKNTLSPEYASEDPEHFQFPWRGRFMPGIGQGADAPENDRLVVPLLDTEEPLQETHFTAEKPVFYSLKSRKLKENFFGAYDPALQTGLAMLGDANLSHLYMWFNSKGDKNGKGRVYTLEFLRSFRGKSHADPYPNSPFTIKAGESYNFSFIIRGITNCSNDEQFLQQCRR